MGIHTRNLKYTFLQGKKLKRFAQGHQMSYMIWRLLFLGQGSLYKSPCCPDENRILEQAEGSEGVEKDKIANGSWSFPSPTSGKTTDSLSVTHMNLREWSNTHSPYIKRASSGREDKRVFDGAKGGSDLQRAKI